MKKLITWKTFRKHCYWKDLYAEIGGKAECKMTGRKCTEKNCPVWKKLKEAKE